MLLIAGSPLVVADSTNASLQSTPEPGPGTSGTAITVAGSATLGPVLEAAAEAFTGEAPDISVDIERSSSGAGLERFCAGEIDLATSGREIKVDEAAICEDVGITFEGYEVAFDGVAVVVNPDNIEVSCVTIDQVKAAWEPGSTVLTWADLDPAWSSEPLELYGMGEESGTYQFFTQVTVGEEGVSRDDYNVTESHPETANAVASDPHGLGFLPYPRYLENQDRLALVAVDGGEGCVAPNPETIQDGSYAPLSRALYVYISHTGLERREVQDYLLFWFADAATFAEAGGLVPSNPEVYDANIEDLQLVIDDGTVPAATPNPAIERRVEF